MGGAKSRRVWRRTADAAKAGESWRRGFESADSKGPPLEIQWEEISAGLNESGSGQIVGWLFVNPFGDFESKEMGEINFNA